MKYFEELQTIYQEKSIRIERFETIDTAYLFTTEDIKGYMPDLRGKKVLSVASSGDHYFNSLLQGAEKVDLFDINYFPKCIISTKKCGLEHLDYDTFCTFFGLYDIYKIFDYTIYEKLLKYLDEESITYWDFIYTLSKKSGYSIYKSDLIYSFYDIKESIFDTNCYLRKENYLELKKILSNISGITFYHTDIKNLPFLLKEEYDVMFFSNINAYQKSTTYLKTIKKLQKFLKSGGAMYFAYIYNYKTSSQGMFFDTLLKNPQYSSTFSSNGKDKIYIHSK